MISTNQFKIGMTLDMDGTLFNILDFQHVKPGKGGAFVRTKLRNLKTGGVVDRTFRAGEKFEQAMMERRQMQFLFKDDTGYTFMDSQTYEQMSLSGELLGEATKYLKEGADAQVVLNAGVALGVELPSAVDLLVAHTDPGVKGDTATGGTKLAELETGATVQVPLFVDTGDTVRVDTRTGAYVTRV